MRKYIFLFIITILWTIGCNRNPDYEPESVLKTGHMFSIIQNRDFKIMPLISPSLYPQRCAIIQSKNDLSNVTKQILDDIPELNLVDFETNNIIIVSCISDDNITRYVPHVQYDEMHERLNIMVTFFSDAVNNYLSEWVAIFECPKVNIREYIVNLSFESI